MSSELSEVEREVMGKINGVPEREREHRGDHPQACLNQRFP